jgi:NADP-dependent aldehyde dehydrogenase
MLNEPAIVNGPPMLNGLSVIGFSRSDDRGDDRGDERRETFHAVNPRTGAPLDPTFFEASPNDVDRAMRLASEASSACRRIDAARRAAFLRAIASEILSLGDRLIERAADETALPPQRLTGERGRTMSQLRMFADLIEEGSWVDARIDSADPTRAPARPDLRRMLVPVGPVAVFGASNFPLAFSVAGGDTASALAAGCPVVVKAHPSHPGTSELTANAIVAAARSTEMPEGVFSLLQGRSHELGAALVNHAATRAVAFTGSPRAGRALMDLAAKRPSPITVFAEMGSVNPVFVLPGATAQRAAQIAAGLRDSATLGAGQFCTKPGVVVVLRSPESEGFVANLVELVASSPRGVLLNPAIWQNYLAGVAELSRLPGVRRSGGAEAGDGPCSAAPAAFVVDGATFLAHTRLSEELFGPAVVVVIADSPAQMMEIANELQGQLTVTIHATENDLLAWNPLVDMLQDKAGRLICNGYPTGVEVCAAMQHGGPYPASSDARTTSVGTASILRFARPVCLQNFPENSLPPELQNANPRNIWRIVDGAMSRSAIV